MADQIAVGIDLGTTNSCVATFHNGHVKVFENDLGARTTPSVVAFRDKEIIVGSNAKTLHPKHTKNIIYGSKRVIGRLFRDAEIAEDIKRWPFRVSEGANGCAQYEVDYKGKPNKFSPELIGAQVLLKMKAIAEGKLGVPIKKAVITVPAYFTDAQREATKLAGYLAGIEVLRIINEPTAAAIAFGMEHGFEQNRNVLVFDLGGGTLDVSVVNIYKKMFRVIGTAGNPHLGGEDYDQILVKHFAADIQQRFGVDLSKNVAAMRKLKTACEKAKCALVSNENANVDVEGLPDEIGEYAVNITRHQFEEMVEYLNKAAMEKIDEALEVPSKDWDVTQDKVDEVILVGGSTRMLKLREMLTERFGKPPFSNVNPDEIVAVGASILAAKLVEDPAPVLKDLILVDATPLTLGIETDNGVFTPIISRNTQTPAKEVYDKLFPMYDNQTSVVFPVYEGERPATKDNHLLGKFVLKNVPMGKPRLEVTMKVDLDNILTVTAKVKGSEDFEQITIDSGKRAINVDEMLKQAEEMKQQDEHFKKCAIELNKLSHYLSRAQYDIETFKHGSEGYREKAFARLEEARAWIRTNTAGQSSDVEKYQLEVKADLSRLHLRDYCELVARALDDAEKPAKVSQEDRAAVLKKLDEIVKWLENNQAASLDDVEEYFQQLREIADPFMSPFDGLEVEESEGSVESDLGDEGKKEKGAEKADRKEKEKGAEKADRKEKEKGTAKADRKEKEKGAAKADRKEKEKGAAKADRKEKGDRKEKDGSEEKGGSQVGSGSGGHGGSQSGSQAAGNETPQSRAVVRCFNCNKRGHKSRECEEPKKEPKKSKASATVKTDG